MLVGGHLYVEADWKDTPLETSRLPALRPTSGAAEALVALVHKSEVGSLERAAAKHGRKAGHGWTNQYSDMIDAYRETGQLGGIKAGITSITRGNRSRTDIPIKDYEPGVFADLDLPDVENVTILIEGTWASRKLEVSFVPWESEVTLDARGDIFDDDTLPPTLDAIEQILTSMLEPWSFVPVAPMQQPPFRVFIGHGGDSQWRELRDNLRDHHGYEVEAFEALPRTGQVISDILQGMAAASTAAVLVLTKADEMKDGTWHGRQNVIHEIGFFQGRLGWDHAIIVVEEGVVLPTNLDGTQQVRFPSGVISAAEGKVAAALQLLRARPIGVCP